VSTTEELLGKNSSDSSLESREYGRRDPSRHPLSAKVGTLASLTSGGRSVGIVRLRTQATEFFSLVYYEHTRIINASKQGPVTFKGYVACCLTKHYAI
jgi:hypothetical protein